MNSQTKPAPPKVVIAPDGCDIHLTAGKEYQVIEIEADWGERHGYGFSFIDDNGLERYSIEVGSAHLNGGNWIIAEREVSHD